MTDQVEGFESTLEAALEALSKQQGRELVAKIRPILYANKDRQRIDYFIQGDTDRIYEYVVRVAEKYRLLNQYLRQLQIEKADEVWLPLLKQLQKWAHRFLVRRGHEANPATRENALECANEAAKSLSTAHFPYDVDFEPWARVLVQHACQKFIRGRMNEVPIAEESIDALDETLNGQQGSRFQYIEQHDSSDSDLKEAVAQLSNLRKQVIELRYFDGLSLPEIAMKLGKTVRAIYSLHFNALQDLRKILAGTRNKLNE